MSGSQGYGNQQQQYGGFGGQQYGGFGNRFSSFGGQSNNNGFGRPSYGGGWGNFGQQFSMPQYGNFGQQQFGYPSYQNYGGGGGQFGGSPQFGFQSGMYPPQGWNQQQMSQPLPAQSAPLQQAAGNGDYSGNAYMMGDYNTP